MTVPTCRASSYFFLPAIGFSRALAGAGIGMGALAADRQSTAMAQPSVAAEVHQPLDVHGDLAPQIAFDDVVAVDHFANLQHLLVGQLGHPALVGIAYFLHDFHWPLAGPIPWMYCNAIITRLLVGILTPAMRATVSSLLM